MQTVAIGQPRSVAQSTPTEQSERSEILDVVRGFALMGVVVMNWYYAGVWHLLAVEDRQAMVTADFDRVVQMLDLLLFEDKFYTIFSMLFGLGFALQLGRATRRGQNLIPIYVRRLTVLFVIGIGHAYFFYYGDILHVYALLGFALILFRNRSDRFILGWSVAIALFVILEPSVQWLVSVPWPDALAGGGPEISFGDRLASVSDGGWRGVVWFNANMLEADYSSVWDVVSRYLSIFWRFLFGFWVGRHALLQDADTHVDFYRRLLPWVMVAGLAGNGLRIAVLFRFFEPPSWLIAPEFPGLLTSMVWAAAVPVLSLAYICMLVVIYQGLVGRRVLGTLAPLGRMALTNYLMQSLLLVFLFFGVGIGLAGRVGIGIATLLAMTTFLLQIGFSVWWLERFRFGPVEWAWRCLTYGRWMSIR